MKVNEGEVPQYYIENSHPAIIAPETFDLVQEEFCRRKAAGKVTKVSALSGRIVCADCGGYYGRKVWHAGCTYATTIWRCNNKFAGREHCTTPSVKEEAIKQAFVAAFNSLLGGKKELFAAYEDCLDAITDDSEYRKQNEEIEKRCLELTVLIEQLVMSNTRTPQPTKDFNERYNEYVEEFDDLKEQKREADLQIAKCAVKRTNVLAFLADLKKQKNPLREFDDIVWNAVLDHMTIYSDCKVVFVFRDGTELPWTIEKGVRGYERTEDQ